MCCTGVGCPGAPLVTHPQRRRRVTHQNDAGHVAHPPTQLHHPPASSTNPVDGRVTHQHARHVTATTPDVSPTTTTPDASPTRQLTNSTTRITILNQPPQPWTAASPPTTTQTSDRSPTTTMPAASPTNSTTTAMYLFLSLKYLLF